VNNCIYFVERISFIQNSKLYFKKWGDNSIQNKISCCV